MSLLLDAGESVSWVIKIDAYPEPEIVWSKDGNEDVIRQQSKFNVKSSRERTELKMDGLELEDTGVYQVHLQSNRIVP